MPFDKHLNVAIMYPEPLSPQDWKNVKAAHIRLVQMFVDQATPDVIQQFHAIGVGVILRILEDDIRVGRIVEVMNKLRPRVATGNVAGIILGNEPDNAPDIDLSWASPSWGNEANGRAETHKRQLYAFWWYVKSLGVPVVSPGWKMRSISEDEPAQPGRMAWAEICRPVYNQLSGNGAHIYGYNWASDVDIFRSKAALKEVESLFHKAIWINEFNVVGGSDHQQMTAYMDLINIIVGSPSHSSRIAHLCLFCGNGNGVGWNINYRIDDPAEYVRLGEFLR